MAFTPDGMGTDTLAVDFDVVCCHVTLLHNFLKKTYSDVNLVCLALFALHPSEWRDFVQKYAGVDAAAAKTALTKVTYMGAPDFNLPFLWGLARDVHIASHLILASPHFAYLRGKFQDRRNPHASRLSYALCSLEDDVLSNLCEAVNSVDCAQVVVYMFDGAIIMLDDASLVSDIKLKLDQAAEQLQVKLKFNLFEHRG